MERMKNIYILTVLYEGKLSHLNNDIDDIIIDAYNNKKDAENKLNEVINSYLINNNYKLLTQNDDSAVLSYNDENNEYIINSIVKIQILKF